MSRKTNKASGSGTTPGRGKVAVPTKAKPEAAKARPSRQDAMAIEAASEEAVSAATKKLVAEYNAAFESEAGAAARPPRMAKRALEDLAAATHAAVPAAAVKAIMRRLSGRMAKEGKEAGAKERKARDDRAANGGGGGGNAILDRGLATILAGGGVAIASLLATAMA